MGDTTIIKPQIEPDQNPLHAPLLLVDGIAIRSDQTAACISVEDRAFLSSFEPKDIEIAYGAQDWLLYPFSCTLKDRDSPTAAEVLDALGARWFASEHIADLTRSDLSYPGYQPLTINDEIHTDADGQYIFAREASENPASFALHAKLKAHVLHERLFYVLLHDKPDMGFSCWVSLFAVGVSPTSGNLIGIATHQACHNFCD